MIELRPFTKKDFQRLISWVESPRFLMQWAGPAFSYPLNEIQLEKHLEEAKGINPRREIFKVVECESGEVIGHIELNNIDWDNNSATISRVLAAPAARGKGIGEAMVKEISRIGFEELHLHRLELKVFDFNERAIACYEKAGFVKEGVIRDARKFGEEYWNSCIMSLLDMSGMENNKF
jgi:RimJ/RimL family protein N-acetyltransferase